MKFDYFPDRLPMVEIEVYSERNSIRLWALIDTGADFTIFPKTIAQQLGISIEKGTMRILEGAGGTIVAYLHTVKIRICERTIPVLACFSEKDDVPEQILGRVDILDHFKLTFDKNHFELTSYET